jgi:hypothetical protein
MIRRSHRLWNLADDSSVLFAAASLPSAGHGPSAVGTLAAQAATALCTYSASLRLVSLLAFVGWSSPASFNGGPFFVRPIPRRRCGSRLRDRGSGSNVSSAPTCRRPGVLCARWNHCGLASGGRASAIVTSPSFSASLAARVSHRRRAADSDAVTCARRAALFAGLQQGNPARRPRSA